MVALLGRFAARGLRPLPRGRGVLPGRRCGLERRPILVLPQAGRWAVMGIMIVHEGLTAPTSILGPTRRVTALSGTRIQEREFRGQLIPTDADDNTLILVDEGRTACGWPMAPPPAAAEAGPSPSFFGSWLADRRAQTQRPAVRLLPARRSPTKQARRRS